MREFEGMKRIEDIILVGYGGYAKSVSDCIERKKNIGLLAIWML